MNKEMEKTPKEVRMVDTRKAEIAYLAINTYVIFIVFFLVFSVFPLNIFGGNVYRQAALVTGVLVLVSEYIRRNLSKI